MKFNAFKAAAPVCLALMLGACATTASETTANKEVDESAETEVGYDVPLNDELVPQAGKQYSKEENDRMVCKRVQVTGSKFNKRVCMTWGEWKQRQEQGREFMQNHNRRMGQQGNPQGG